jgi:hypothetical protein
MTIVVAMGMPALARLEKAGFEIRARNPARRGLLPAAAVAILLAALMIALDAVGRPFGDDINVLLPKALLFYPVMAFVAEIVFHAVPLSLLSGGVGLRADDTSRWRLGLCFSVVALLEPTFQVVFVADLPAWMLIYLPAHLLVFNVAQLWLYRRHDFLTMIGFRMIYYLAWHILWGYARLL